MWNLLESEVHCFLCVASRSLLEVSFFMLLKFMVGTIQIVCGDIHTLLLSAMCVVSTVFDEG